ncbi:UDP-N-acetylglucosamine 1-carboxyvinyltransferase [Paenactinomyces guangxiensis]|uniref:UDP-N-acetylglucosamine 1-carboxyvinyltransferase n=1 Tax=Paenactinomyces guangxiensis TaxID=1490290 RepID=A0A7W1WQJ3_9BACL|nr:UDP-N-acetylglucosamine 1-carboxyvinyltransferase [Paenactinomyces guangxiensis]MBA4494244.1 UDP-N-acetylglucosamine 1-carboxyvinyltransferase [Paenactinomyces guangxiensis]MBH8590740.1 UDP-N-acetylglucosamine 1-carboxyvinyltransferase [Paenactinomyces guangxiensis]
MEHFVIKGGKPLSGSVRVQGAKNAALPILAATVLTEGVHEISDVPDLTDIAAMCSILEALGAKIKRTGTTIQVDTYSIQNTHIPDELMSQMRSSIFLMGPLLARLQQVSVTRPGGCAIGSRPIDIHLKGLARLGATIIEDDGVIHCSTSQLTGTEVQLDFPSVGATENVMMAAVLAEGQTIITNAAREPEIIDLQNFLNKMGAKIQGAGSSVILIKGVKKLKPVSHQIIPDRIVAGTLVAAVGATAGEAILEHVIPEHLSSVLGHLKRTGLQIEAEPGRLWVRGPARLKALEHVMTEPYPGFPTDMQPQMLTLLSLAEGTSRLTEKIFESRLKHVRELVRMGADLQVNSHMVIIHGVSKLSGTHVSATDLRAGAALAMAGLAAEGTTILSGVKHIDRGYAQLEKVFRQLGGEISRKETDSP